jgi:photosystem II stability/assembly factor-like uncharacterized protein
MTEMEGKVQISRIGAWPGGTVVDLAVCGETVLAATFAGICRSTDGGQRWALVDADLPDWFILTVALAPVNAGEDTGEGQVVALAASRLGWLYRSVDGGQTWEVETYWRDLGVISRLVMSPDFARDGVVFACTEEDGIFKSTDRGRTWKSATFGLLNLNVTSLCFSPTFTEDEIAFAGTDGGGLFRSRNAGRAWRESGEGLPATAVQCLAISPHFDQDGVLYAGTEDEGLYRSVDGGSTWAPIGESLAEACVNSLYLAPDWAEGGQLVAATDQGILISTDGGQAWQEVEGGPFYPYVVVGSDDGLIAGAYDEGVFLSPGGRIWQAGNRGLTAHIPPAACFSAAFEDDRTLVLASMEETLVRSQDGGQTWQSLQEEEELSVALLAGAGEGESMVLLVAGEADVACSLDSGESWTNVADLGEDLATALALSDTFAQDRTMLVGTAVGQLLVSGDGGGSWERQAYFEGESVIAVAARAGGQVAAVVTAQQTERGTWQLTLRRAPSWEAVLARETAESVSVLTLTEGERLFCAMGQRLLCLEGDTLVAEEELEGEAPVSSLAVSPAVSLAGTRLGLYRSADGGSSWERIDDQLSVVALHLASPTQAYAVSMGGEVWAIELS